MIGLGLRKKVLVTGGGGSIGSVLVKKLLDSGFEVVAFDIDEYALSKFAEGSLRGLRTFLGDVKDSSDVERAVRGCDAVIHVAAVKMVDVSSYHPIPCIRTNVEGTINLINEALRQRVERFLYISSDKAVDFAGVYGATKFIGERLTLWANTFNRGKYSVCRFGNVIQSRGNVFEIWEEQRKKGEPLTVTHPEMKRYFWSVNDAVAFILKALKTMKGGEIFIPKMPSYRVIDLAKKISSNIKRIPIRPDEVMEAKLYSDYEKEKLEDLGDMWVIR